MSIMGQTLIIFYGLQRIQLVLGRKKIPHSSPKVTVVHLVRLTQHASKKNLISFALSLRLPQSHLCVNINLFLNYPKLNTSLVQKESVIIVLSLQSMQLSVHCRSVGEANYIWRCIDHWLQGICQWNRGGCPECRCTELYFHSGKVVPGVLLPGSGKSHVH